MKITIEGSAVETPRWGTIQRVLRELLNDDDGKLTRIARPDGRANYRALGVYELTFVGKDSTDVTLEVK